ncbi:DeoR family transcriptional regulator, aga operon transcriptional repressor [Nonomuraea maritima]|uniref:DeoR family transcriptional regulator, aga operon transcriptional repressor n=1 Tax=Nonomuraea maritima TaxID=683260 RepID=A0A1G9IK44_9ACTN|nr:DeoR/GlpR family DNA-binding transcription regulator [Nonomuraea maritima]SDL25591.1 DeoR family transcriptional regulator, aga operon transcriptional repressor [Nonomuraea maritima]
MSRYDRWNAIMELLVREGRLSVEEAARALEVSTATIRRDLDQLAQQQMLMRTRGGAVAQSVSYDLPLRYKTARHADEKHRIAAAAAELVTPGAVVGLNGGTTTSELARALATLATLESGFTVVTNALNIAAELTVRQHVKIVVTGGVARQQSYELIGPLAGGVLEQVTLDVAFLGVDALDVEWGASAHHEGEAGVNHQLVSRAAHVVVVADSSKLGKRAFARICPIDEIDTLVTDARLPDESAARFADAGVKVIRA